MQKFKLAIFDLDGVLVDTAKYHYLAWKKLAVELFDYDFCEEDNERFKGVSRLACMDILCELAGKQLDEENKVKYANLKNDWYVESIADLNEEELLTGAKELLIELKERNIKVALGSASKNAKFILSALNIEGYFDFIADGTNVSKAKPDPEVFTFAADSLGVDRKDCVVFEDAFAGVEAAHAGNMFAVGIGEASILVNADMIIKNLSEVPVEDMF